ncbi:MAG: hypothetical protein Tsb0010_06360 [Parvularculaceae bacterium]
MRRSGPKTLNPKAPSQRQMRAGELVRHALSEILSRGEARDPLLRAISITVTEARLSPDLKNATVFFMPLGGERQDEVLAALNKSAAFLRGKLSRAVDMKNTPALKFELDRSFGEAARIEALLRRPEVARDLDPDDD